MNESLIDTNALQQQVFSGNFSLVRHNDLIECLYKIDVAQELNDPDDVALWKNRFWNLFNNSIQPAQTNPTREREPQPRSDAHEHPKPTPKPRKHKHRPRTPIFT
jgi:hypothetical protein